jgi:hypothetical protein
MSVKKVTSDVLDRRGAHQEQSIRADQGFGQLGRRGVKIELAWEGSDVRCGGIRHGPHSSEHRDVSFEEVLHNGTAHDSGGFGDEDGCFTHASAPLGSGARPVWPA